jgi:hypothetical protein
MSSLGSKGRLIFIIMATLVVLADVVYIVDGAVDGWLNKDTINSQVGGLVLLVAVLYWLSRGSSVAWWIIVVLFVLTGVGSLVSAVLAEKPSIFNVSLAPGWPDPVLALSGIVDLSFVGVLLFSKRVREYLDCERRERRDARVEPTEGAPTH